MSRMTITITAPNGAKVRTVRSKRYFVVAYGTTTRSYSKGEWITHEPRVYASVIKRTDSVDAARQSVNQQDGRAVYVTSVSNGVVSGRFLTKTEVEERSATERQNKKFAASVGNNGEARRLFY